jgi:hypothetical protein
MPARLARTPVSTNSVNGPDTSKFEQADYFRVGVASASRSPRAY